jgi:DNA-directed RNA polymerase
MLTEAQVQEQVDFERECIRLGLEKLHKQTYQVESRDYASASVYGCASINTLIPLVVDRIEKTTNRISEGKTGAAFAEIQTYLKDVEPLAAAGIACKIIFDKVFSFKDEASLAVNIADSVGTALEQECQMRFYEAECPGLLHTIKKNYWHSSCGTQQRFVTVRTMMNRNKIHWDSWGRANRVKLGGWLIDCVCSASGWFTTTHLRLGKKSKIHIAPTAAFMDIKDEVMANAADFSAVPLPMLVPPKDWTDEPGGYLLNEVMQGHDMVRRGQYRIQQDRPKEFLNKIQKVGFCLNKTIVEVAEHLFDKGIKVGKFVPIIEFKLPNKPLDIATNEEARQSYRREAAETMNKNAASFKKSCRTRMTMEAVKKFKARDVFYHPWSFDYRGRVYPIPSVLTPQDTDFGKSLLKFHKEAVMNDEAEQWLAFQVATTYGLDKKPMIERLDWVKDNITFISEIAKDPIGRLPDWESADEPWQFLAACDEYYHCVINCDRNYTSLPVATDATCSGLQILAGLCRDASTAKLVNVLPSDSPQDAYATVAEAAKPNCPESIQQHLDRSTVKRVVMTVPYNAKPHSNRGYIRSALKEKGVEIEKDDLTKTVTAVRDAMHQVVPGPMKAMKWIEEEVGKAIARGATELEWVTPSGFVVSQRLMKKESQRLQLQLLGAVQQITVSTGDSDKVDKAHHKNATAPNLIHSLDASLLLLSTLRFDAPIALIHDSVLCRATDMNILSTLVRETYMHIFAEQNYLQSWADQIGAETKPPIIGDLEPSSVIESTYFFC